jgi:2-isopropylmalate synthase
MSDAVQIYDTTLRDGAQGEGINFSLVDKLRIAEKLDQFGVHYIEGGWPGSNPKDLEFFARARERQWHSAKVAAFGFTRRKGVRVEEDEQVRMLLDAGSPVITLVGKTWLLHVHEVLRVTPEENLAMIRDTVAYLRAQGREVVYDAEHSFDGFKDAPDYALATWRAAEEAGASCVVLCDTNGGSLPGEVRSIVGAARAGLSGAVGIHTHNDCGLGVANALAGVEAGAVQVQGTVNGFGERTGNCNLITAIPVLAFKMGRRTVAAESLAKLKDLSEFVDEIANLRHDARQPWVGQSAFAHKGGIHVHAVERVARSYEHIDPALVGNQRRVLVSDMSGRTNILVKAAELGFTLQADQPETRAITARIKQKESEGYEYEAAEASLSLLIQQALNHYRPVFELQHYATSMNRSDDPRQTSASGQVWIRVNGERAHAAVDGDGPVHALDQALRKALSGFYPELHSVELTDYKVRIVDSTGGTKARTRVLITSTDGTHEWSTVGVSDNIIEASWLALVDSVEYYLLRARK